MKRYFSLIALVVLILSVGGQTSASVSAEQRYPAGTHIAIKIDDGDWIDGIVAYDIDGMAFPYGIKNPAELDAPAYQVLTDIVLPAQVVEINGEVVYEGEPIDVNIYQGVVVFR